MIRPLPPSESPTDLAAAEKADLVAVLGVTKIVRMAFVDPLTGAPNRHRLAIALERRLRAARATVFVRADLDGFKDAQDCVGRGHEWGDACLRDFVNYVGSNVRQLRTEVSDEADMLFGREGGDEFLIVATSYEGAGRIAQAIGAWTHEGVTASVGIGVTVQAADAALYAAKRARRRSRSLPRRLRIGLGLLKSLPRNLLGRLVA